MTKRNCYKLFGTRTEAQYQDLRFHLGHHQLGKPLEFHRNIYKIHQNINNPFQMLQMKEPVSIIHLLIKET